ncbi:MAG: VCBS repeat-containing protein, partial [Candidatus Cloacimonas sp.]|nr:VCBS repeat-containing protein [Candidatus Cloacimonas sp.]
MKRVMLSLFVMVMLSCLKGQNNTFTDINAGLQGVSSSSVAWGDYDNDGDLDILVIGYSGSDYISKVYCNNGNSSFTDINAGLMGTNGSASWGDFDNDGDLDILLAGFNFNGVRISKIYRNNGNNSFSDINANLP